MLDIRRERCILPSVRDRDEAVQLSVPQRENRSGAGGPNVEQPRREARWKQSQGEMGVTGAPESAVYESSVRTNRSGLVDAKRRRQLSLLC